MSDKSNVNLSSLLAKTLQMSFTVFKRNNYIIQRISVEEYKNLDSKSKKKFSISSDEKSYVINQPIPINFLFYEMFERKINDEQKSAYKDFKKMQYNILNIKPKKDGTLLHSDFFKLCEYNIKNISEYINRTKKTEEERLNALIILSTIAICASANYIENNKDIPEEIKQNHIIQTKDFLKNYGFTYDENLLKLDDMEICKERLGINALMKEKNENQTSPENYPVYLLENNILKTIEQRNQNIETIKQQIELDNLHIQENNVFGFNKGNFDKLLEDYRQNGNNAEFIEQIVDAVNKNTFDSIVFEQNIDDTNYVIEVEEGVRKREQNIENIKQQIALDNLNIKENNVFGFNKGNFDKLLEDYRKNGNNAEFIEQIVNIINEKALNDIILEQEINETKYVITVEKTVERTSNELEKEKTEIKDEFIKENKVKQLNDTISIVDHCDSTEKIVQSEEQKKGGSTTKLNLSQSFGNLDSIVIPKDKIEEITKQENENETESNKWQNAEKNRSNSTKISANVYFPPQ